MREAWQLELAKTKKRSAQQCLLLHIEVNPFGFAPSQVLGAARWQVGSRTGRSPAVSGVGASKPSVSKNPFKSTVLTQRFSTVLLLNHEQAEVIHSQFLVLPTIRELTMVMRPCEIESDSAQLLSIVSHSCPN
jgi:hypothetical protein